MARQTTLNVSLTATLQKYVRTKVKRGGYESASEVIRESLRALQERERAAEMFWTGVREKVAVARRQISDGNTHDGEHAMDEILAELDLSSAAPRRSKKGARSSTDSPTPPDKISAKNLQMSTLELFS